jgi:hypothetical protein
MSVISVAPIESMVRRALVKNLKNHKGNSLWAINDVPCLLSAAPPGTGLTCSENVRRRSRSTCGFGVVSCAMFNAGHIAALRQSKRRTFNAVTPRRTGLRGQDWTAPCCSSWLRKHAHML